VKGPAASLSLRAGIDVGGTFTDLVTVDVANGKLTARKTPSTRNQADGILTGLSSVTVDLASFTDISHGTTVATNLLLEGKGARTALVTTPGFRDTIEIGRCRRLVPGGIFNLRFVRPRPIIARQQRFEVEERIGADGAVLTPLDEGAVMRLGETIAKTGVEAVAVCFVNSYVNPTHERRAQELLRQALNGTFVCCSSDILPLIREYERFSTTAVNCAVAPAMARYMASLVGVLRSRSYRKNVYTMASNAGLLLPETVMEQAVRTVLSGPAAAVNGAMYIGKLADRRQLITYDMGGTSTDVCLIDKGEPLVAADTVLAGMPIGISQIDIHSIGTGGGSVAWADVDGSPRVGPRSAGALPGPIAYGKSGSEVTVTDANLLLGWLPEKILDGAMMLAVDPVRKAFDQLVVTFNYDRQREDLAEGLIRLAVASMAGSVRRISIERGHDPRDFSLFAIGGAGPVHATLVADELEIPEIIVPPMPGNISALGHLVGDLKHDAVQNFRVPLEHFHEANGATILDALTAQARRRLGSGGARPRATRSRFAADLRYVGQSYQITVPLSRPFAIDRIRKDFVAIYRKRYGHVHQEAIEFTSLQAICSADKQTPVVLDLTSGPAGRPDTVRDAYFGGRWHKTAIVHRSSLHAGRELSGPAIVEEYGATTVVPPGWMARCGAAGCLFLTRRK
jgi:N-methylhydantoinase A